MLPELSIAQGVTLALTGVVGALDAIATSLREGVGALQLDGLPAFISQTVLSAATAVFGVSSAIAVSIADLFLAGLLLAVRLVCRRARRKRAVILAVPSGKQLSRPSGRKECDLRVAVRYCRSAFIGIGVFSAVGNTLMLTGAFFMLQVYDRVLPSRSIPTLVGLGILAFGLFVFQGILDFIRARVFVHVSVAIDESLSARVYDSNMRCWGNGFGRWTAIARSRCHKGIHLRCWFLHPL